MLQRKNFQVSVETTFASRRRAGRFGLNSSTPCNVRTCGAAERRNQLENDECGECTHTVWSWFPAELASGAKLQP